MTLTLLLPWFPIVLAVGIGGHLLGRERGWGLGVVSALFWVVLTQSLTSTAVWTDTWSIFSLLTGSVAIVCMGAWAGKNASENASTGGPTHADEHSPTPTTANTDVIDELASLTRQFNEWLTDYATQKHPWPAFGEFVRSAIHRVCCVSHVKPYRLTDDGDALAPLRDADPVLEDHRVSARRGVIGHVLTSGRSYVAGDATQGPLVEELAAQTERECAWCFPICRGHERLGVVCVEQLEMSPRTDSALLAIMEELIGQFWRTLDATIRQQRAEQTDPVSHLPTRPAFLRSAGQAVVESYKQGEPVAFAIFSVEGIRDLTDHGRWHEADELVADVARTLMGKLRTDDRVGRFDGSRFAVLFRRVDSELATLIVNQLMSQLETVCDDESRWGIAMKVRCALVGSGTEQPDIDTLVTRTLTQERRARTENMRTATDIHSDVVTTAVS